MEIKDMWKRICKVFSPIFIDQLHLILMLELNACCLVSIYIHVLHKMKKSLAIFNRIQYIS